MRTSTPENVPTELSGPLSKFCEELGSSDHYIVPVLPPSWAKVNWCYPNAVRVAEENQGRVLVGWKIWHWPRVWYHAAHHAVVLTNSGELLDVTPQENGAEKIFFAQSDRLVFDPSGLSLVLDRYKPLWQHRKLAHLLKLIRKRDRLIAEQRDLVDGKIVPTFEESELLAIIEEAKPLWDWVARNRKRR